MPVRAYIGAIAGCRRDIEGDRVELAADIPGNDPRRRQAELLRATCSPRNAAKLALELSEMQEGVEMEQPVGAPGPATRPYQIRINLE